MNSRYHGEILTSLILLTEIAMVGNSNAREVIMDKMDINSFSDGNM